MEERELVLAASCGDDGAFVKLYELYYQKLYKYALYTLRTKEDAEDAVSSTVADVYGAISGIREPEKFGNWIFQILSNKCKNKMREYYRDADNIVKDSDDEESDITSTISSNENIEDNVMVKEVLQLLSENEREIINLSVFAGYKSEEIGEMLHMNASTVRSTRKRTLAKLAKIFR